MRSGQACWPEHRMLTVLLLLMAGVLGGCASVPNPTPSDPLESWNRAAWQFNDNLDHDILKPVATNYRESVPAVVRQGVGNFFNNLADGWTLLNDVMQLKGGDAAESFTRFWVNSFFGLGGMLDVATEMQIPRHKEDFGQTLGYWGVGAGPYLVLPVLGPSTLRDTAALPIDWWGDAVTHTHDVISRNALYVGRVVHQRAGLLQQEELLEAGSTDRYSLMRDVYLQYRRNQIYDGNPPDEPMDDMDPDATDGAPAGQPSAPVNR